MSRRCGPRAFKAAAPLRWNDTLATAARLHAQDMARHNNLDHTGRDGYRFRVTGENLAGGPTTPEVAVAGWIKSPGHCANLS